MDALKREADCMSSHVHYMASFCDHSYIAMRGKVSDVCGAALLQLDDISVTTRFHLALPQLPTDDAPYETLLTIRGILVLSRWSLLLFKDGIPDYSEVNPKNALGRSRAFSVRSTVCQLLVLASNANTRKANVFILHFTHIYTFRIWKSRDADGYLS